MSKDFDYKFVIIISKNNVRSKIINRIYDNPSLAYRKLAANFFKCVECIIYHVNKQKIIEEHTANIKI